MFKGQQLLDWLSALLSSTDAATSPPAAASAASARKWVSQRLAGPSGGGGGGGEGGVTRWQLGRVAAELLALNVISPATEELPPPGASPLLEAEARVLSDALTVRPREDHWHRTPRRLRRGVVAGALLAAWRVAAPAGAVPAGIRVGAGGKGPAAQHRVLVDGAGQAGRASAHAWLARAAAHTQAPLTPFPAALAALPAVVARPHLNATFSLASASGPAQATLLHAFPPHAPRPNARCTRAPRRPQVALSLRGLILKLYDKHLSADGRAVSYKGIKADPLFQEYVRATAELQKVRDTCRGGALAKEP